MSAQRGFANSVAVYVEGREKSGWCCAFCHRPFDHGDSKHLRGFGRFIAHRIVRHRRLLFGPPTGKVCRTTHQTSVSANAWELICRLESVPRLDPQVRP